MMDRYTKSFSVIMPVYNELRLIEGAVSEIQAVMERHFAEYEILIIESGSTDGTSDLCDSISEKYHNVRVIHEEKRKGFGSALKLGYSNARYEYCWLITADIPFDLDKIKQAVPLLDQYDCVLSYREHDSRSLYRKFQSLVYNILVKCTLHLKVRHINSAFKVYPTRAMSGFDFISKYWFIDAEVLYRVINSGYSYIEIPVPLIDRQAGESTVSSSTFIQTLHELFTFMKAKKSITLSKRE